jgi:hypothetical protein
LYGHEAWSLSLQEEHILRVFENRVLGRILGPKRVEVTGGWRKFVFFISIVRMGGACSRHGGDEKCLKIFCY